VGGLELPANTNLAALDKLIDCAGRRRAADERIRSTTQRVS
jgi:hypothetical protein